MREPFQLQFPNIEPLSRLEDDTSKIAEERYTESGKRDSHKTRLLRWLREHHIIDTDKASSLTAHEIAEISGIAHPTVHKRLPDLMHDGYVSKIHQRVCRVTGEFSWTWAAISDKGYEL